MQIEQILVNELQIGESLGHAVSESRRSDFGLILAMLSPNVLDNAEFVLPSTQTASSKKTDEEFREYFQLQAKRSFAFGEKEIELADKVTEAFSAEGLVGAKLNQYLNPEGLAEHDNAKHIPEEILENCELSVRMRHQLGEPSIAKKVTANPAGLYDVVSEMRKQAA